MTSEAGSARAVSDDMKVLVAGGAGYVGSHCVRSLIKAGHDVVVYDSLVSGHRKAVDPGARLIVGDLGDRPRLQSVMLEYKFEAVMHFAAFIEVGESVKEPLKFYENNVANTIALLTAMKTTDIRKFIFSSTCAVFGTPEKMPLVENTPMSPASPYARNKLAVEWMLADSAAAWGLGFVALRYFNAAGASADGSIGEDHDPETHLIPNVLKVALQQREAVKVFGTDYPTPDGTCVRDYVHVEDLADAHIRALGSLKPGEQRYYNTGTGRGASVREVVEACRRVTKHPIPIIEEGRRAGDVPTLYADSSLIQRELGWKPKYAELEGIVASAWKWHAAHPRGFEDR